MYKSTDEQPISYKPSIDAERFLFDSKDNVFFQGNMQKGIIKNGKYVKDTSFNVSVIGTIISFNIDSNDNIIAISDNGGMWKIDNNGKITLIVSGGLGTVYNNIYFDNNNNAYFVDTSNNFYKVNMNTTTNNPFKYSASFLDCYVKNNNIFVLGTDNSILQIDSNGNTISKINEANSIGNLYSFNQDEQGNFITTDSSGYLTKIFNNGNK